MAKNGCFIRTCILVFLASCYSIEFSFGGDVIVATVGFPPAILISSITVNDTAIDLKPIRLLDSMLGTPGGIVYDGISSTIYWKDERLRTIDKYYLVDGTHDVFISDVDTKNILNSINIDVIDRKLYWVDDGGISIYVINLNGTGRMRVFTDPSINRFNELQIDSTNRYLYGIVVNMDYRVKIERISLDDHSFRQNIIEPRYSQVSGMSISENGKLYWYDGGDSVIWECDLDGTNSRQVANDLYNVLSTQVYRNYVYYNTAYNDGIGRANIETGDKFEMYDNAVQVMYIYSGDSCNIDCRNGAVCINSVDNTQSCWCPTGFVGPRCTTLTGYCKSCV
ncbi:low-density lipoprotein receptor-related protein 5-like [Anneissia japonica]|uniref:low-density lipoprotein receptor-related protein 5-like n=1 Tax=Anneissia japonica TaxID=1529436 RepID=UPI001425A4D0|nr:low-density lipoprotein receptor-related protein 5-like [Anneissia japonica]XP_033119541.1 low-density lipoprotein receptor-related protein 5-like [Anneissia japonica]